MRHSLSLAAVALILACCLTIYGETPKGGDYDSQKIDDFISKSEALRLEEIDRLKTMLRKNARGATKKEVAEVRKRIKELEKGSSLFIPNIEMPIKAGAIGRLNDERAKVIQVIDDKNMIVRILFTVQGVKLVGAQGGVGGAAVPDFKTYEKLFWAKGFDTAGLADDSLFSLDGVLEVSGTKMYETVGGGTETLFILEPFNIEAARKAYEESRAKKPKGGSKAVSAPAK